MSNTHSTGIVWIDRGLAIIVILIHSGAVVDHFGNFVRSSLAGWLPLVIVLVLYALLWALYIVRIARHQSGFKTLAPVLLAVSTVAVILMFIPPRVVVTELPVDLQVLVTDLENKTGEPNFPVDALRNTLTTALKESVHISIPPETRIQDAFRRMMKSPAERMSVEIGRDLCTREGLGLLIAPAIVKSDRGYGLEARVLDPKTGQVLYETAVGPFVEDEATRACAELADTLRKKFGESSWSIYRTAKPLAQATSKSLGALELYTRALKDLSEVKYPAAEDTLNKALALDPDLALAWVELASIYEYQGNNTAMLACASRAFSLRERLTDPEKARVNNFYYWHVENDHRKALSELTEFLDRYPKNQDSFRPLAYESWLLMEFDRAEQWDHEALGKRPWETEEAAYDLWQAQLSRDKFKEALETASYIEQDIPTAAYRAYIMAIPKMASGQMEAANVEIAKLKQTNNVTSTLWLGGFSDIYTGKLRSAIEQWTQYIRSVEPSERTETPWVDIGTTHLALARVALLAGDKKEAARHLESVKDVIAEDLAEAGKYHARLGNLEEAQRIFGELKNRFAGRESNQNRALLKLLEGEIELKKGNSEQAFNLILDAAAYAWTYLFFSVQESLGNAALASGHPEIAVRAFENILGHRGLAAALDRPDAWIMAQYYEGRSYEALGDKPMALSFYFQFENFWHDGDATLPDLLEARKRIAQLKG